MERRRSDKKEENLAGGGVVRGNRGGGGGWRLFGLTMIYKFDKPGKPGKCVRR